MSVNPKYYYNLSGNITDGKKEYSLHHKENKIGGLSISSGLKENYIEYGTNSLLDLLNELNDEIEQSKMMIATLRNIVLENEDLEKENRKLKNEINLLELKLKEMNDGFDKIHKMYMEQIEENKRLKKELDSFNPVVFNDMIKGTVILYNKGDM